MASMVAQVAMAKTAKTEPQEFQAPQEPQDLQAPQEPQDLQALQVLQDLQALQVLQVVAEEVHLQHQEQALAKEHFVWVLATPQSPLH
jgi:hypothetical protein